MLKNEVAYLNGKYSPKTELSLSILDRGFLFGDGVYELVPIYNKKIFYVDDHLNRLRNSLEQINISSDFVENDFLNQTCQQVLLWYTYWNRQSLHRQWQVAS